MKYFLSYVVIKGQNTNQFGHAYSVLSRLDDTNPNSNVEVVESVGLYGDPFESNRTLMKKCLPAKLFGPGHLKQEHLRHIAASDFYHHDHKTWEVTEDEKDAWLAQVEQDAGVALPPRDFVKELEEWERLNKLRQEKKPANTERLHKFANREENALRAMKGGYFSLFKNTCMTDAKCRLNQLGINTQSMQTFWLDIPGLSSGPLLPMKLGMDKGRLIWKAPLVLTGRHIEDFKPNSWHNHLKQFQIVYLALEELIAQFEAYQANNQEMPVVMTDALGALKELHCQAQKNVQKPLGIKPVYANALEDKMTKILGNCHQNLTANTPEPLRFVSQMMTWLKSRIQELGVLIGYCQPCPKVVVEQALKALTKTQHDVKLRQQGLVL